MTTKETPLDTNDIISSYKSGKSIFFIAKKLSVDETIVSDIISNLGYKVIKGSVGSPETCKIISSLYINGMSQKNIAIKTGFSVYTVNDVIARNIKIKDIRDRSEQHVIDELSKSGKSEADIINAFQDGIGIGGMPAHLNVSVACATSILKKHGIKSRGRSEQQFARMKRTSPEDVKKLTLNANKASRGRTVPFESLAKRAKTVEKKPNHWISSDEVMLRDMLLERGIYTTQQKAIGAYNCDLATDTVIVEVFGGNWHWHGDHLARTKDRVNYILNQGFSVLMVANTKSFPITSEVADYIASYIEQSRRNPTRSCEYRVIWGASEYTTFGGLDDDNFSIEPPFTSTRNRTNGQYMTIIK